MVTSGNCKRVLYPGRIGISSVGFCGGRKTGEPGARMRTNEKLNPHMASSRNRTQATLVGGERSSLLLGG